MQLRRIAATLVCVSTVWLVDARPEARSAGAPRVSPDEAAVHEMLEGRSGRRETWATAPALVIVGSVMNYGDGNLPAGCAAVDEQLTATEIAQLTTDLTQALGELTAGTMKAFRAVTVEAAQPGDVVKIFRPGHIVVGRFRGVEAKTGNLGYGGRMTHDSTITGAAVLLDAAFDRKSDRRQLLRTHELGHALGYNHVESRPSVMNPRVGSSLTDFDRATIRMAFVDNGTRQ